MYEDEERAKHSVRFSFNELTTDQEIKYIVAKFTKYIINLGGINVSNKDIRVVVVCLAVLTVQSQLMC